MPSRVDNNPIDALVPPDALADNISHSRLGGTVVGRYAISADSVRCETEVIDALSAFRRETSVILRFDSPIHAIFGAFRQESLKTYILKLLLFLGISPTGNGLAVLARLVEVLTMHPELTPDYVITDFAKTHRTNFDGVMHIIEKRFNIYDVDFYDRVTAITESHPMTPKDVLCDLSVCIRVKYMRERNNA